MGWKKMRKPSKRLVTQILIILLISTSVFPFAQATEDTPPMITVISPSSGEQGQTLELTISGKDFVDGADVYFSPPTGITVTSIEFVNHMELRATIAIAVDADVGPRDVTVTNPDNQSHTLNGGFTVTEAIPPSAITGLTATDAHDGKVDLTWNPSEAENFAYYAIYVAETEVTDVTGLSPTATITDITTHMYQVTGLKDGTAYYFAVTAVDTTGNEHMSVTSVSATPTKAAGLLVGLIAVLSVSSLAIIIGIAWHFNIFKTVWDWLWKSKLNDRAVRIGLDNWLRSRLGKDYRADGHYGELGDAEVTFFRSITQKTGGALTELTKVLGIGVLTAFAGGAARLAGGVIGLLAGWYQNIGDTKDAIEKIIEKLKTEGWEITCFNGGTNGIILYNTGTNEVKAVIWDDKNHLWEIGYKTNKDGHVEGEVTDKFTKYTVWKCGSKGCPGHSSPEHRCVPYIK